MINKESPLQGMTMGRTTTVLIRELRELTAIDLRVKPGTETQIEIGKILGVELPGKPGSSLSRSAPDGSPINVLCLAPDWWLVTGSKEAAQQLASLRLNEAHHLSVVDVSDQRTTIELEGPNVREVLSHVWEQDLRLKNFPVGSVSQGQMAKAQVILYHTAPFRYSVMVRSSFALHVWKTLIDAAEEWV